MARPVITIKPALDAEGKPLVVRDPVTMQPLPPEGVQVEKNTHWIRRINAGDVTLVSLATTVKTAKSAAKE